MRKSDIISYILCFTFLIFACAPTKPGVPTTWVENNMISVAWDPVTKMRESSKISEGDETYYLVYIRDLEKFEQALTEKYVDGILIDKEIPIAETSCTIRFIEKGQYVIGVQSVILDEENNVIESSLISWSNDSRYAPASPFGVRIVE